MSMEFLVRIERSNGSRPAGCGSSLDQMYWQLCDIWGIVVQAAAALGFVSCVALASVLLLWMACASCRCGRPVGTAAAALLLFLLGTAGMFALPFSFVISLSPQTCPVRVFLFGLLFCIVFGALLARGLALMDVGLVRGWREAGMTVTLTLVQVIISVEWLLVVLIRDERTCEFSQAEFAMLQIYVMVILAAALATALRFLCDAYITYSYSYTGRQTHRHTKLQAALLVLTLLLSVCVWIVWITLLIYGNRAMGHSPDWDDPVISIALTANGWVLLLGHGFTQVHFMCQCEARTKDPPLHFTGWTSPGKTPAAVTEETKTGRDNSNFQMDTDERRGKDVESPGIIMTEISTEKDYSIPRPTTTNINKPYDEYYIHRV